MASAVTEEMPTRCPATLLHLPFDGLQPWTYIYIAPCLQPIVQELCESRGGRPELSVLTSLLASVDVKIY